MLSEGFKGSRRLNNLLLSHIHQDMTNKIDILDIAREFVQTNERRLSYFGTLF